MEPKRGTEEPSGEPPALSQLGRLPGVLWIWWPATGAPSSLPGGIFGWVGRRPPSGRGHRINKDRGTKNLRCVRDFLLSLAPGVELEERGGMVTRRNLEKQEGLWMLQGLGQKGWRGREQTGSAQLFCQRAALLRNLKRKLKLFMCYHQQYLGGQEELRVIELIQSNLDY